MGLPGLADKPRGIGSAEEPDRQAQAGPLGSGFEPRRLGAFAGVGAPGGGLIGSGAVMATRTRTGGAGGRGADQRVVRRCWP